MLFDSHPSALSSGQLPAIALLDSSEQDCPQSTSFNYEVNGSPALLTKVTRLPNHWCAISCATTRLTYRLSSALLLSLTSRAVSR
jgi:hypothetical protein